MASPGRHIWGQIEQAHHDMIRTLAEDRRDIKRSQGDNWMREEGLRM